MLVDFDTKSGNLTFAIIRSSSIGDVVLSTACLDFLHRIKTPCRVVWFGRHPSLQLIEDSYPMVKCIDMSENVFSKALLAKFGKIDSVFDLQSSLRSFALCMCLRIINGAITIRLYKRSFLRGIKVWRAILFGRGGWLFRVDNSSISFQYKAMVECVSKLSKRHKFSNLADYKECLEKSRPRLEPKESLALKSLFKKDEQICFAVAPGSSYETKSAPSIVLAKIINQLDIYLVAYSKQVRIVFLGDAKDKIISEEILALLNWRGEVVNLCGKLNLADSAAVLKYSRCILCNDSSLLHIGEAVGAKSIALFGPTVEAFGFATWREDSRTFSVNIGCRPCSKHGQKKCRYGDKKCFTSLDTKRIAAHIFTLISNEF